MSTATPAPNQRHHSYHVCIPGAVAFFHACSPEVYTNARHRALQECILVVCKRGGGGDRVGTTGTKNLQGRRRASSGATCGLCSRSRATKSTALALKPRMHLPGPHDAPPEVQAYLRRRVFHPEGDTRPDGTATVTKTLRVTYGQNWPPVNAAQAEEKRRFVERLADLTKLVQHHSQTRGARVSPSRIWRLRARARSSAAFRVGAS